MNILLSEPARDAFFAHLVKQTVLERIRGGQGICYSPPLQSAKDILGNTYSSGSISRGNTHAEVARQINSFRVSSNHLFLKKTATNRQSLTPLPTSYAHQSHGCYAEELVEQLNQDGGHKQ